MQQEKNNLNELKDDFLRYVGGQSHVKCRHNNLPLITSATKDRLVLNAKRKKNLDVSQCLIAKFVYENHAIIHILLLNAI